MNVDVSSSPLLQNGDVGCEHACTCAHSGAFGVRVVLHERRGNPTMAIASTKVDQG